MNDIDRAQRLAVAEAGRALRSGRMGRRQFLRICAKAGFVFSSTRILSGCKPEDPHDVTKRQIEATAGEQSAGTAGSEQAVFLKEVGKQFRGTKLVVIGEKTPPSQATIKILEEEFTPITGIDIEWRQLPLEDVLAEVSSATARKSPGADIFYLDQAWLGRFVEDTEDPRELMQRSELAYPQYDFGDIIESLVDTLASYRGRLLGIPFDIPVHILIYRRDILEELELSVPKTMSQYAEVVAAIQEAKAPRTYGTTGMWKAGHYSLTIEALSWVWSHGGSVYGADTQSLIADEYAQAGLEYMLKLGESMPPGVTSWDWDGQAKAFANGMGGMFLGAGEWFSLLDDPAQSKIVGMAEAAPAPQEIALRSKDDCSFDETPGLSRQGGSCLAISKYSQNVDAAWIFLQWATSLDVTTRANLLGGGASPIRKKTYADSRTKDNAKVQVGTTRHLPVTLDAILNRMGTEPHLPGWETLAVDQFAVELGRLIAGEQDMRSTLDAMAKAANELAAKAT